MALIQSGGIAARSLGGKFSLTTWTGRASVSPPHISQRCAPGEVLFALHLPAMASPILMPTRARRGKAPNLSILAPLISSFAGTDNKSHEEAILRDRARVRSQRQSWSRRFHRGRGRRALPGASLSRCLPSRLTCPVCFRRRSVPSPSAP